MELFLAVVRCTLILSGVANILKEKKGKVCDQVRFIFFSDNFLLYLRKNYVAQHLATKNILCGPH